MSFPSAFHSLERQPRRGFEGETVLTGHSCEKSRRNMEGIGRVGLLGEDGASGRTVWDAVERVEKG